MRFQVASLRLDAQYAKSVWHIAVSGLQRNCATVLVANEHRLGLEAFHAGDDMLKKRDGKVHPKFQVRRTGYGCMVHAAYLLLVQPDAGVVLIKPDVSLNLVSTSRM